MFSSGVKISSPESRSLFLKSPNLTPADTLFSVVIGNAIRPFCVSPSANELNIKRLIPVVVLVVAAARLPTEVRSDVGRPVVTAYAERETGINGESWATVQDKDGTLYFGCSKVLSFDGSRWTQYSVPGTYAVLSLALGNNDRLWVSGINEVGYFDKTEKGLSAYHSLVGFLPKESRELGQVWQVIPHGNGAVFLAQDNVLIWDGRAFEVHRMPGARRISAALSGTQIFICHLPTGIWKLDDDGLHLFISVDVLGKKGLFWIEKEAGGWLLVTTDGLFRYQDGKLVEAGSPEISDYIRRNILLAACRTSRRELCLGTLYGGLVVLNPTETAIDRILTPEDGLPSRGVYSAFIASDRTMWITSPVGVAHIAIDSGVSLFDSKEGLAGKDSQSITQSKSRLLVATEEGVFGMDLNGSGLGRFTAVRSLSKGIVNLETGPGDTVYASGYKRVVRLEDGDATEIFSSKTDIVLLLPSLKVPGSLLVANGYDIQRLRDSADGTMAAGTLAHLPETPVSMVEDNHGNVWAGTYSRGAFVLDQPIDNPVTLARPTSSGGLTNFGHVTVAKVADQVAVFTTKGVEVYPDSRSAAEFLEVAPKTTAIAVSNQDSLGSVWVAFESPFSTGPRIPILGKLTAKSAASATWAPFAIPGLSQIGEISSIYVDVRGVLWIGGMNGILRLVPDQLNPVAQPGPPLILANIDRGEKLEAKKNSADFEFSAVQFGGPESYRFQTKLSGGSDEWSPPTEVSHLGLTRLQNGSYELSVRVLNEAGVAGPAATWGFTVLPPWYRTAPAILLFAGLMAAGVFGAFKWRLAFLKRQNARLEILVQKKTEQLEKANEAKSEFLANMSHEIRNPISGILGLSLAFEETQLDKRQRHLVDSINSCATLLAALVDDVLDFSKIEAGKIELRSAPFSLRILLEQCVAMIAENARVAGTAISIEVSPKLAEQMVGDSARVQQILLNYLTNALKFGAGKPIVIGANPGYQDRVRFFVRDQGLGMSEAEIATLFTKFTRLESARAGNIRGTGLGLAVSRLLATKMGGRVGVESKPGMGSTFWAELPFLTVNATGEAKPAQATSNTTLRALIVEDIDYNVIAMQAVLRKLDIQSDVVNDGAQALARLQSTHYDVAFLDWNLPGMIGTEVAARYRAVEPSTRRTIIIATTAHSSDMNKEACLQAGMDAFISKPITPGKIAAALRDLGGPMRTAASIEVRSQNITFEPPGEIDLEMLTFLGNETLEGLSGQIDRFLASFDSDRVNARRIIASGVPAEIHRIAHRLMSHCSVVKYERLGRIAREIQNASGTASQKDLQRMFAEFEKEFASFRYKLESIRA